MHNNNYSKVWFDWKAPSRESAYQIQEIFTETTTAKT